MSTSDLVKLGTDINKDVTDLATFLASLNGDAQGETGDIPTLPHHSQHAAALRARLLDHIDELQYLVQGDTQALAAQAFNIWDVPVLSILLEYGVPQEVPKDRSISYNKLSKRVGMDEERLTRLLRYAFTNLIFQEKSPGYVSHTRLSSFLAAEENAAFVACLQMSGDDCLRPAAYLREAFQQYPSSQSPIETAFNLAFSTDQNYFEWLATKGNESRLKRFNTWQEVIGSQFRPVAVTTDAFPWRTLGDTAKVVDIGGNSKSSPVKNENELLTVTCGPTEGHVSIALAKQHPNLTLVVQDQSAIADMSSQEFMITQSDEIQARVSFMGHNFFDRQPITDADAYLFRNVLHDWPDAACVQIVQNVVLAMKPGARIIVADSVIPEAQSGMPRSVEKTLRQTDIQMMAVNNAKERTVSEFISLLSTVDDKLVYRNYFSLEMVAGYVLFELQWVP